MNKLVLAVAVIVAVVILFVMPYAVSADNEKPMENKPEILSVDNAAKDWLRADRGKELRIKPDAVKSSVKSGRTARSAGIAQKPDEIMERLTHSKSTIKNNEIALGVNANDLRLVSSDYDEPLYPEHKKGISYTFYEQTYLGVPVYGSHVGLISINGEDVVLSSNTYEGIDVPVTPTVTAAKAAQRARQNIMVEKNPKNYSLIIFPVNSSTKDYRLAWKMEFPTVLDPPRAWTVVVDAHTGEVIGKENRIRYSYVYGNVTGLVYMDNPTVAPVMANFSNLNVTAWQNGAMLNSTLTDSNGLYNLTGLSGNVFMVANLNGPYADVINADQARANHSTNTNVPAIHGWNWSANDTSYKLEESTVFYHMNRIHDFVTKGNPFNIAAMDYAVQAVVEYSSSTCNAFTDLIDLYFYGPGGGCDSTALGSDVVYHEYGHIITDRVMGISTDSAGQNGGSMHEGFADYFAATIRNDSVIGLGIFPNPIRYLNNTLRMPDDFDNEVHDDSRILSGALWNLRGLLGNSSTDNLTIRAMKLRGTTFTQFLADMLTVDDDNANLSDDTPHIKEICNSFYRDHGIFNNNCLNITLVFAPSNTSYTSPLITTNITYRGTSWCGYSLDGAVNVTLTNSSPSWHSVLAASNGGHNVKFYCNDTSNAYVSSDAVYFNVSAGRTPAWGDNITSPASPARIASGNVSFQIRWTDPDNGTAAISGAIFRLNNTNYTRSSSTPIQNDSNGVFWINATLNAGSINEYQWYANDTENLWNSTQPMIYRLLKSYRGNTYLFENNTPMKINDYPASGNSSSITVPNSISGTIANMSIFVGINHTYIGDLRIKLQSPGGKVITLHNQTGGSTDDLFTWYDNETSPATAFGLTQYWDDDANGTWFLNATDLGAIDVGNITKWEILFVIDEGSFPQWSANNSYLPSTYNPGSVYSFQTTWNDTDNGYSGVSRAILQLNSTNYTNYSSPAIQNNSQGIFWINLTDLAAGTYSFRWYANNTANNWNSTPLSAFTVYKQPTDIALLLNGTAENAVYNVPAIANFTAYLNVTGKNITLTSNMSGWIDQNATNVLYNTTLLRQLGIFKMTAYFSGDGNYSSSLLSLSAIVVDTQAPLVTSNETSHSSGIQYGPGRTYTFNITTQDNLEMSNVILQLNSANFTASMYEGSASSDNWSVNVADLAANAAGYPVIWYVNDTSNNWNKSGTWYYAIAKNTSAYTIIRANTTMSELPGAFHFNSSSTDANIETRLYTNNTVEAFVLLNASRGVNVFTSSGGPIGLWNISANSSANENYTANATLEHIIFKIVDTTPPGLESSTILPRNVSTSSNITLLIISDDYSDTTASATIYNTTNASITRFNMSYVTYTSAGVSSLVRTTFSNQLNTTGLPQGLFIVNVSLTDASGNSANYPAGNFTVSQSDAGWLYVNSSLSIGQSTEINLSGEMNITLNISSVSEWDYTDSIAIAAYTTNPSKPNLNAIETNKYYDLAVGGRLNYTIDWVEIRILYKASDIPSGYSENNLRIYKLYPNSSWMRFDGTNFGGVNTTAKYVWANTTSFSLFGAFIMPTCSDSVQNQGETGTDCGGPCSACAVSTIQQSAGGGGSATATTTTIKTTTTTTMATATTTTTTVAIPTTTTLAAASNDTTAHDDSATDSFVYADKSIRSQFLLFASVTTIAMLVAGTIYKNKKNVKRLVKNLSRNLRLE